MNDETKAAADAALVESMVQQLRDCVSVGDEMTLDHASLLDDAADWIAGEPARTAAAVVAAQEEQREADAKFCPNCLGVGFVERPVPCPYCDDSTHDHYCPTGTQRQQCGCGAERIRATPLDATPLADELRTLRAALDEERVKRQEWQVTAHGFEARVAELEAKLGEWAEKDGNSPGYNLEKAKTYGRIAHEERKRAEKAEAQVAEAHERLDEFGIRRDGESATLVEGITSMRERIDEYRAEWYRAEAQVAAARAWAKTTLDHHDAYGEDEGGAYALLRAMDEAAKK